MSVKTQLNGGATDWIVKTIIGSGFVWALYAVSAMKESLTQHEAKVSALSAQLTAHLQVDDSAQIHAEIVEIHSELQRKANSADVPPPEVIRWLTRLEQRLDRMEEQHRGK